MKYTIGDAVRFRIETGEVQEGNIQFIDRYKEIVYINSYNRWAYKVPQTKIIAKI